MINLLMMKRFKEYNPNQNYLITLVPSQTFPKDSFEYFIIEMMDKIVNVEDFYPDQTDKGGSEIHDPKAILGIIFYSYAKGIYSYRKMAWNCQYNTAFIYISGYTTPDHSTISRFIRKFKKPIMKLFSLVLYVAAKHGFVDYKLTATDGTKIIANASDKFSGTIEDFEKRQEKLNKRIEKILEKCAQANNKETQNYWENKKDRCVKLRNKLTTFLEGAEKIIRQNGKEVKQNITDNDARTMRLNGNGYKPGYNAQATVCGKNGLIIGADVTNQANDLNQLQPMLELSQDLAPEKLKDNFKKGNHLADNGYDSAKNAIYAEDKKLNILIPPGTTKELFGNESIKLEDIKSIGMKHCKKEKNENGVKIICPGKQELTKYTKMTSKGETYYDFRVYDKEKCKACKYFKKCCEKSKGNKKSFRIKVELLDNWEIIQRNYKRIKSEEGQIIYSKRMGAIEKVFGHIKENLGCKRVLVRGIKKVETVWNILCITYNLQRIFNLSI